MNVESNPDTEYKIKYVAQFRTSHQISPDDWETVTPTMMATDKTTIGEIREWMDSNHYAKYVKEFKIITLE